MTRMRKLLSLVLAAALAVSLFALPALAEEAQVAAEPSSPMDYLGNPLPDFSVETISGETFTLSEELKEKKAVLINLWATWCGPCRMEFPYLEQAYEMYQDQISVIALSTEVNDTPDVLADFVEENGMTFDVGSDSETRLADIFVTEGIPTSVVVDRFGNVVLIEVGAQTSIDPFVNLFELLSSDNYTETQVLYAFPPTHPNVKPASSEELAAALNVGSSEIIWSNPEDDLTWPMIPAGAAAQMPMEEESMMETEAMMEDESMAETEPMTEESMAETEPMMETEAMEEEPAMEDEPMEGPASYVVSTNTGRGSTISSVTANLTAARGDALCLTFRCSTEAGCDFFIIELDGTVVKVFGGDHDWTSYAFPFKEDGEHKVVFSYFKDQAGDEGEDMVCFGGVSLLSGEDAEKAIANNPKYVTGEETLFSITSENARKIVFEGNEDDLQILDAYFDASTAYIVFDDTAKVKAVPDATVDPEGAFFYNNCNGEQLVLTRALSGEEYLYESPLDKKDVTGYTYTNVYFYTNPFTYDYFSFLLFADEENANAFVDDLTEEGLTLSWKYDDGSLPSTDEPAQGGKSGMSSYTVTFTDQNGDAVPGCIINFCTDETCVPVVADENGMASFEGAPYEYHLQVIKVPEGYTFDTTQEFYADPAGGELNFEVTKD